MTTYFLNVAQGATNQGLTSSSAVSTGTSAPQNDFYVSFGGGNQDISRLSRSEAIRALDAFKSYINKDGNSGVAAVIPFGLP